MFCWSEYSLLYEVSFVPPLSFTIIFVSFTTRLCVYILFPGHSFKVPWHFPRWINIRRRHVVQVSGYASCSVIFLKARVKIACKSCFELFHCFVIDFAIPSKSDVDDDDNGCWDQPHRHAGYSDIFSRSCIRMYPCINMFLHAYPTLTFDDNRRKWIPGSLVSVASSTGLVLDAFDFLWFFDLVQN